MFSEEYFRKYVVLVTSLVAARDVLDRVAAGLVTRITRKMAMGSMTKPLTNITTC
jgi:hypothetical protein